MYYKTLPIRNGQWPFIAFITFFLNLLFPMQGHAQTDGLYDRPGLTVIFVSYDGLNQDKFNRYDQENSLPDKYYGNPVEPCFVVLPGVEEFPEQRLNADQVKYREAHFQKFLSGNDIGRKVVGYWFNYDEEKGFDMSRIFKRAEYNATDEEIMVSQASKRGEAMIRDYGQKLVSNSYVVVVDLRGMKEKADDYGGLKYSASVGYYFYELQFGDEQISQLYESWIYEDDSEEIRKQKMLNFKNMDVPLKLEFSKGKGVQISGTATKSEQLKSQKSKDDLAFEKFMTQVIDRMDYYAAGDIEELQVETKVMEIHPLKAKIGNKESLKIDHKYFVYEYVWDDQEEKAVPKRKAVVRALKVADNTREVTRSKMSEFYQVYGTSIREGMILRQKPELGLSVAAGYEAGGLGGLNIRLKYRTRLMPALYLIGDLGFSNGDYTSESYTELYTGEEENYSFVRFDAGLGKGIRLMRFIELMPYAAYGKEMVTVDEDDYSTYIFKGGLYAGIALTHNVYLYGQANYSVVGKALKSDGNDDIELGYNWDELFKDRSGGVGIEFGLNVEF
jgi:hypothetical protein